MPRTSLLVLMAVACFLAVAMGVTDAVALSGDQNCDPSSECVYDYTQPSASRRWKYNFSSLCSGTDYVFHNAIKQHVYYANVCGTALQNCLPASWTNTHEFGVTVQMWGSTPPCGNPPACKNKQGKPACCTAPCQVLGVGAPEWSLIDPSNPETGGVRAHFTGIPESESDPFWCEVNPVTKKPYLRQVTYEFLCDHSVVGSAQPVSAAAQPSNDCNYTLTWKTAFACGDHCASDQVASKCDAAGTTCSVGPYTAPTCSPTTASLVMGTPSCHGGSCSSSSASPIASVLGKACSSGDTPPVVSPVFFPPLVCANGHWEALSSSLGVGDPCTADYQCVGNATCTSNVCTGVSSGACSDGDCPAGQYCGSDSSCHAQASVGSVCTSDDSCASGLVCAGSICLTPYSTPSGRAPVVANALLCESGVLDHGVCVNPLTYLNHQPCSRTQTSGQPGYTCLCNSSSSSSGSYFPVYNTSSVISSFQALEACKAKSGCTRGSKVCSAYHCLSELVKYEDLRLSLLISRYEGWQPSCWMSAATAATTTSKLSSALCSDWSAANASCSQS